MERLVRYFRGYVRAAVRGVHPERVLNACAEAGIPVREAEPAEDYLLRITVPERHFKRVQALAERCQCTAEPEKRGGAPKLLRRVRRHRLLLALLALCVAAALASSLFVWDVQVTGNETVSTGTILRELEACKQGDITPGELEISRRLVLSSLRMSMDSPVQLDEYYIGAATAPRDDLTVLMEKISALTVEDLRRAAQHLTPDTIFFLKGVQG